MGEIKKYVIKKQKPNKKERYQQRSESREKN